MLSLAYLIVMMKVDEAVILKCHAKTIEHAYSTDQMQVDVSML